MSKEDAYADIIGVEYPFKSSRPRMSMAERAAQFAPFAALTGYDALIERTRILHEKGEEEIR